MNPDQYIIEIKSHLIASPVVAQVEIVEAYVSADRGYIRVRLRLINNDFLETAEYFASQGEGCVPVRYRYQWMDEARHMLRKRWDNVRHFPGLANFPDHVHVGSDAHVEPGQVLSTIDLLAIIEQELQAR
jgi:hypothetical protein